VVNGKGEELSDSGVGFAWCAEGTVTEQRLSLHDFFGPAKPWIFGCAAAWNPRVLKTFGPLPNGVVHEDEVMALRAAILGPYLRIASPLVQYRLHGNNVFGNARKRALSCAELDAEEVRARRELQTRWGMYAGFIPDLKLARTNGLITGEEYDYALAVCYRQQELLNLEMEFHNSRLLRKCHLLMAMKRKGLPNSKMRNLLPRLMSKRGLTAIKLLRNNFAKVGGSGVKKGTISR
jgi:hypothetical protein